MMTHCVVPHVPLLMHQEEREPDVHKHKQLEQRCKDLEHDLRQQRQWRQGGQGQGRPGGQGQPTEGVG